MIHLPILYEQELGQIHNGTLKILAETGIVLKHKGAIGLLLENGASTQGDRVLIPEDLVMDCLSRVPPKIKLQGIDPEKALELGGGNCYAHNVGGVPNVILAEDLTRRPAKRSDNVEATRLLDALPNVDSITPLYTPQDVPGTDMTLWMTYDTLLNTTKPFRAPGMQTDREVDALAEMAQIACPQGSITVGISPVSPLNFPDNIVDAILTAARHKLTLGPLPCPILGATAPMSIAGGLAQQNAEVLATLVLAQIATPGLPMIYKGRLSVMDPRSGLSVWGNPEIGLISAATVEISHSYGLPADVYGLCTNAHRLNIQNGYERALNALLPLIAGADEISGVGEMEGGVSSSLAQIIIDDEIISSLKRIKSGFKVDETSLGLDVIAKVMRKSRNFLAERHTIKHLRTGEVLNIKLAVRDGWSQWEKSGRQSITERAVNQAEKILETHEIPPLDSTQIEELNRVVQKYSQN
jgi:trimethylamine--corrinoid protein Co-methyltransferase